MELNLDNFLIWAKQREPEINFTNETWFVKEAYQLAEADIKYLGEWLPPEYRESYLFNYTLHLICITQSQDNPLYKKYFPYGSGDLGLVVSSASDSTSSGSYFGTKGLSELGLQSGALMTTPYGQKVLWYRDSLKGTIGFA